MQQGNTLYIGLGSNIGDRLEHLHRAIAQLTKTFGAPIASSPIYSTEPWGNKAQDDFLNQVVAFHTSIPAAELPKIIATTEETLGRVRVERWGPRIIDIDVLMYGSLIFNNQGFEIPHPQMIHRLFVLRPLADINEHLIHPVEKKSIKELLMNCSTNLNIQIYST